MSTVLKFQIKSISSDNTELIGEQIGSRLIGGEAIKLNADLGGGKTTFTRGLLRGMGSKDMVASPTFTISKIYKAKNLFIHHFDFYRLNNAGVVADELAEVLNDPNNVVIIEWANIVNNVLPKKTIDINLDYDSELTRLISLQYLPEYNYLFEDLK